jgi:hypothetical protein
MIVLYRVSYARGRYALSAYFYERERAEGFARTHRGASIVEEAHTEVEAQRLAGLPRPKTKRGRRKADAD